ncbi:peroxin [Serendipita sp. 399]|nr:peroxin [Serendipita sp. 399]
MAYMPTLASRILEELDVERVSLELQNRSKKSAVTGSISNAAQTDTSASEAPSTHPSTSIISAAEAEASSSLADTPNTQFIEIEGGEGNTARLVPPLTDDAAVSERNTSSFLSAMESTDPLSESLPLSSEAPSSPASHHIDPLVESATSWVKFQHESSQTSRSGDADDEKPPATNPDDIPTIPDLELPTIDLAAVSIVDSASVVDARQSDIPVSRESVLSYMEDRFDGQSSLQRKSKAELWHELKIMCKLQFQFTSVRVSLTSGYIAFTRVLVTLYSTALLSLQIHIQLNLIGRYKYVQSVKATEREERERQRRMELESASFDSLGLVGSLMASVAPGIANSFGLGMQTQMNDTVLEDEMDDEVDEDIERKYLTLCWWLLHIGWRDIASRVRTAVEEALQGVSLKTRLDMSDLKDLFSQIRKQVEFLPDGQPRTEIPAAIFPLSPSAEQNVLIQGGISPHLATIDPPLRRLLDDTKAYVASPDFQLVWNLALDKMCAIALSGIEKEVFGGVSTGDTLASDEATHEEKRERLAAILPGLARWCHPALYGMPNELVENISTMRELVGFSAIIYSSYDDNLVQ